MEGRGDWDEDGDFSFITDSFIRLFHTYVLSTYYVPDTRDAAGKIPKLLAVADLTFSSGRQTRNEASIREMFQI